MDDKIDEHVSGLNKTSPNIYTNPKDTREAFLGSWKDGKQSGKSRSQFYKIKKKIKEGKKVKLNKKH